MERRPVWAGHRQSFLGKLLNPVCPSMCWPARYPLLWPTAVWSRANNVLFALFLTLSCLAGFHTRLVTGFDKSKGFDPPVVYFDALDA